MVSLLARFLRAGDRSDVYVGREISNSGSSCGFAFGRMQTFEMAQCMPLLLRR